MCTCSSSAHSRVNINKNRRFGRRRTFPHRGARKETTTTAFGAVQYAQPAQPQARPALLTRVHVMSCDHARLRSTAPGCVPRHDAAACPECGEFRVSVSCDHARLRKITSGCVHEARPGYAAAGRPQDPAFWGRPLPALPRTLRWIYRRPAAAGGMPGILGDSAPAL